MKSNINIIQPDDWHVHLREGDMLKCITQYTSRLNRRCIAMPNTKKPITTFEKAIEYIAIIKKYSFSDNFEPLVPCYLTDNLDLKNFRQGLKNNIFIGAKLYPLNVTTNSKSGIADLKSIYNALQILEEENKLLLIHGEKSEKEIDIFDREKAFIDDELNEIKKKFPRLKIVLEHVSTEYGVNFIKANKNIAGTITPHHMMLTKNDLYIDNDINPHHFCMPVVKSENDLISLRKAACNNNTQFFLGTDSAPHHIDQKISKESPKPGIFSATSSIELYASIFEEENAIDSLETFSSINGPKFYDLPINDGKIKLFKEEWIIPDFVEQNNIKVKNFYGGKKLNWKVKHLKV